MAPSPRPVVDPHDIRIRPAGPADRDAIVALAGRALGWRAEDPNGALFSWKHDANPFGASPAWVAEAEGGLVGLRAMLRWEFLDTAGRVVRAVRAVDTATDPQFQGRGIFRRLTLAAVDAVTAEGVSFVFNTPNEHSRPGYLKMGWEVLGRVPIGVAVRNPVGLAAMALARVPAGKWSEPCDVGDAATAVFGAPAASADRVGLVRALGPPRPPGPALLVTNRTPEFFAWRYAAGPLQYRVLRRGRHLDDGFAVFRLRRRGAAIEATICDLVHPEHDWRVQHHLVRAVLAETGASYAISVLPGPIGAGGRISLPGQGPIFTWRPLARSSVPPVRQWALRLGDIELF